MSSHIILLYHDLDSEAVPCQKTDAAGINTVVSKEQFYAHMAYLKREQYSVISMARYIQLKKDESLAKNTVVLTFDDGHVSNYLIAFPILVEFGFTASFYIVSEWVGTDSFMTDGQITEMHKAGMEIGSHTASHRYLSNLSDNDALHELSESKQALERICNGATVGLAYPGGHFNKKTIEASKHCGYEYAMSCQVGYNNFDKDHYRLNRIELRRNTDENEFAKALTYNSIRFFQVVEFAKKVIRASIGLDAYSNLRRRLYLLYPFKR